MSAFDLINKKTKVAKPQGQKSFVSDSELGYYHSQQNQDFKTKESQLSANVGWVFKGNERVASSAANVEIELYQKQLDGDREIVTSGELHDELFELLEQPNERQNGTVFRKLYHSYLNLNGDAYVVAIGENPGLGIPYALEILPSHLVEYQLLRDKDTGEWREIILFGGEAIDPSIVWRDLNPDPSDPTQGLSIVGANALTIDMEEQSKQFNRQFFANSARPSLVVTSEKVMTPDQYKRFKQQMDELHSGIMNAYKPLILEGGATGAPFALSQRDMDFLDSRKFNKDEILAMFGVSPAILGMVENVNRSNMDAAKAIFAEYEIKDRANQLKNFLNTNLLKYQPHYEFDIVNPVPEDAAAELEKKKAAVNQWMTVNEIRALDGLPPIPGGDVIPALYEMMQKMNAVATPITVVQPALDAGEPEPDDPEEEKDDEEEKDEEIERAEKAIHSQAKELFDGSKKKSIDRNSTGLGRISMLEPELNVFVQQFTIAAREIFEQQRFDIIQVFSHQKSITHTKSLGKDVRDLFDERDYIIDLDANFRPIYGQVMEQAGINAASVLPIDFGGVADTPDWTDWITQRSGKIAKDINAETQKQILATLKQGLDKGENTHQLRARLEKVFGEASSVRAERIARTEAKKAASRADLFVWEQSGVVEGKEWFSQSGRPCPWCASMEGKTTTLNANFFNLNDEHSVKTTDKEGKTKKLTRNYSYEAIEAPPLHPNCMCVLLPVISKF